MAPRDSFTITLYFCFEHDELWGLKKNDLINLGIDELKKYLIKNSKSFTAKLQEIKMLTL